jgi:hypothetical protein
VITENISAMFAHQSAKKHEPASDADAAVVDSLKALDLNRPIREADINTVGETGMG